MYKTAQLSFFHSWRSIDSSKFVPFSKIVGESRVICKSISCLYMKSVMKKMHGIIMDILI